MRKEPVQFGLVAYSVPTVAHPLTSVLSDVTMAALIGPLRRAWTARLVGALGADATCCKIMGLNPQRMGYLQLAAGRELTEDPVPQIGEPLHAVATRFAVLPELERLRLANGGQKS